MIKVRNITINNITDLKTFLARKKLERAQKIASNELKIPSEAQPSQRPQNFQRANQKLSSGEISRKEFSLSLTDGKRNTAANGDRNQSRDSGLADRSQMRESGPTTDSDTSFVNP